MTRITRAQLDQAFRLMAAAAAQAGLDVTTWRFGKPVGVHWAVSKRVEKGGLRPISPYWGTMRQAYEGMSAMACAFEQLTR